MLLTGGDTMFSKDPFFRGFDEYFEKMHEEMERMMNSMVRRFDEKELMNLSKDPNTKVYGFSMRIGPDGKPVIREFGNIRPNSLPFNSEQKQIKSLREPLIDIMESDKEVTVIAEIPGVEKNEIVLDGSEDQLNLEVKNKERPYKTTIALPCEVIHDKASANYKNGVLTIKLPKKMQEKPKKRININ